MIENRHLTVEDGKRAIQVSRWLDGYDVFTPSNNRLHSDRGESAPGRWSETLGVIIMSKDKCYYCGVALTTHIPDGKTHFQHVENYAVRDHVYPRALGGTTFKENIVYCCTRCNSKKSSVHPLEFYEKNNFSHWSEEHLNDFMFRVKGFILYESGVSLEAIRLLLNSHRPKSW